MAKIYKLNKKNPKMVLLKSISDLVIGDHIGLPVGEHKVFAEVVGLPHPHRPLIVYKIVGTESIGVVNLKRSQVFKVYEDVTPWIEEDEDSEGEKGESVESGLHHVDEQASAMDRRKKS